MYIVTVTFQVQPAFLAPFMAAMKANADETLRSEPACHQFDVCVARDDAQQVFLYEVYQSETAFRSHLEMPHFKHFSEQTSDWVKSKVVTVYERL